MLESHLDGYINWAYRSGLVENDARAVGLGGIVDGWGDELAHFRA